MAADSPSTPFAGSRPPKSRVSLAGLAGLLLFGSPAAAQGDAEVTMRLDLVAWGDAIGGLSLKDGKGDGKITALPFTYSEPVSYTGPRLLEIHQTGSAEVQLEELEGTPEDEAHRSVPLPMPEPKAGDETPIPEELARRREETPTLVALAALPANSRRATILLARAAAGTYRAYVIDDDPSRLPPGSLRVHNLSPVPIALQFPGLGRREMSPGDNFRLDPGGGGHAAYRLAYRSGDDWIIQENNLIPVPPDRQTQFVVLKSDNRFFLSADGASGGFLQSVTLTRDPAARPPSRN